ncbi:hypothetical protein L6164_002780 [Bauhinia variegata]|uniref:Uncharacterized protein n=1 Tax=Bauhinia variegata TaxID=167791 RepID=A0ACB9PZ50_BAUVA|nr:hypothetical protein L6164_002780 [Bauhinia variegata]
MLEFREKKRVRNRVAPEEPLDDSASGTDGNVVNGEGYGHCSPLELGNRMFSSGGEETPMLESDKEAVEAEAAAEDAENEGENEPAEVGWPEETNTWEPLKHLTQVSNMIDAFEKSLKSRKQARRKRKHTVLSTSNKATEKRDRGSIRTFRRKPQGSEAAESQGMTNILVVKPADPHVSKAANSRRITINIPIATVEPREVHVFEVADSQRITSSHVAAVEPLDGAVAGNAGNNDHSDQREEGRDNPAIIKIIKPCCCEILPSDTVGSTVQFLAMRLVA